MSDKELDEHYAVFCQKVIIPKLEKQNADLVMKLLQSEQREELLKECVEFYGDGDNWFNGVFDERNKFEHIDDDKDVEQKERKCGEQYTVGGKKAREALKQIKEMK
jgi:hypothetical protein